MTDNEYHSLMVSSPENAQNLLFDEYFNYVYTIVFNKLRSIASKEDIEECVSDAFADAFFYLKKSDAHNGDLKGLIASIAARRSVDMFRKLNPKSGRTVPLEEAGYIADSIRPENTAEASMMRSLLLDSINQLGEPDSTIVMQKYYGNMNSRDIGKNLSLSPAAVRVRCSRALKKLKNILAVNGITLKEADL